MDSDHVSVRLTARQRSIVEGCDAPRSLAEFMVRARK